MWTTAASLSRLIQSIGDKSNKVMTDHVGYLWSMATCSHHEWVATSGSEGSVYSKNYSKIPKKVSWLNQL
jgi:hypothetical protein